ncbi:hypothetical protein GX563_06020 [Candidatus Bathyarchaeota archaeon]|nr:hypothetical protein [Candidatus Bathyarchaeota archaeon]
MPNTCWECNNNTLKLRVLVPHDRTIKEYMHQTCNLQSEIVAVVKDKRELYKVWFRSGSETRLATLKILHTCNLHCGKPSGKSDCPLFSLKEEACQISNIIYSKQPVPQELKEAAIPA